MSKMKRRDFLKTTATVAAGAAAPMVWVKEAQAQWNNTPEKGAKLRVLRWSRFVQGDIDQYMKSVAAFTAKTGIEVKVDNESWEDVRPKAAVAANTGAGPDIILGTNDDANLYPEKLLDVTDLATYLGKKYGGWYPAGEAYLRPNGKTWIGIPLGAAGSMMVYRESQLKAAGFDGVPKDTDGFLKMMKALHAKGTPGGFALGHATGDANTWCHWVVWAFGGKMVDKSGKVTIDSPETLKALEYSKELYSTFIPGTLSWLVWAFGGKMVDKSGKVTIDSPETLKALEYGKELYSTFIPGTLSWLDPSNNKVFLDGQISITNNGISVYYAAKTSKDPKVSALAADINHSAYPAGPAGNTAFHLFLNQMIFKYTKYPKAAKEFIRFMMEEEQYGQWMQASIGYVAHPLAAYAKNPIWTVDPKHIPYRDAVKDLRPAGYDGKLGYASAGALADFIMVDMVAEAASGSKSPKEAMERAAKRAERYYKV